MKNSSGTVKADWAALLYAPTVMDDEDPRVSRLAAEACAALGSLATHSDGIATPSAEVLAWLYAHLVRCREFGALMYECGVRLREAAQSGKPLGGVSMDGLPQLWAAPGSRLSGMRDHIVRGGGSFALTLEQALRAADKDLFGSLAPAIAKNLRLRLGLVQEPPTIVSDKMIVDSISVGAFVGADVAVRFRMIEYSDGTTTLTLLDAEGLNASIGAGTDVHLACGPVSLGGGGSASLGVSLLVADGRTIVFRSRAEAEAALKDNERKAVTNEVAHVVASAAFGPFAGLLGGNMPHVFAAAPIKTKELTVGAAANASLTAALVKGAGASTDGGVSVTATESVDSRSGTFTDSVRVQDNVGVGAEAGSHNSGASWGREVEVSVTRDGTGKALALTVTSVFSADPGRIPNLADPRPMLRSDAVAGGDQSLYRATVTIDLADPRNAEIAKGLDAPGNAVAKRVAADDRAVEKATQLDSETLQRSRVVVTESTVQSSTCDVAVSGAPGVKVGVEVGRTDTTATTVQTWTNHGAGELVQA